jgi:ribosomal protein L23
MTKFDAIKSSIVSEKSTGQAGYKVPQYSFLVDKRTTKGEIKAYLKVVLEVDAVTVNTLIIPGKIKRVASKARQSSRRASYKKAIVTLKSGQKLDLYEK